MNCIDKFLAGLTKKKKKTHNCNQKRKRKEEMVKLMPKKLKGLKEKHMKGCMEANWITRKKCTNC